MQRKLIESDAEVPNGLRDPEGHRVRAERVQAAPGAPAESGRLVAGHGVQIPRMDEFLPTGTVKDGVLGRFHVASMFRFDGFFTETNFLEHGGSRCDDRTVKGPADRQSVSPGGNVTDWRWNQFGTDRGDRPGPYGRLYQAPRPWPCRTSSPRSRNALK